MIFMLEMAFFHWKDDHVGVFSTFRVLFYFIIGLLYGGCD